MADLNEPTIEQIKDYCRNRNLVIITKELFIELLTREIPTIPVYKCKKCGCISWYKSNYCPNCGQRLEII